jgi:ATP-dependent RNA helicase RhlE
VDELNQRQGSIIVFFRTKRKTDEVSDFLQSYGFKAGVIHGDRTQGQRNRAIQSFKEGKMRILCATDVAARGIDIPSVTHVINFDLPRMEEDYVHRIGRTARNGADGEALSFVARQDHNAWRKLAKRYKITGVELDDSIGKKDKNDDQDGRRPKRNYDRRGSSRKKAFSKDKRKMGPGGRWAKSKNKSSDGDGAGSPNSKGNYPKRSKFKSSKTKSASGRGGFKKGLKKSGGPKSKSASKPH